MPGLLGSRKELENHYHWMQPKPTPYFSVRFLIYFRRLKKDVAKDLPPKIEAEIPCKLNQEQATTYHPC